MAKRKKTLKVDNLANFEFWLGIFKPRTKVWQRKTLRDLKNNKNQLFAVESERGDKIKALNFLLGKNLR